MNLKNLPVNVPIVKQLLIRLMTRNEQDRVKAVTDRATMLKNFETLGSEPEAHLGYCIRVIDKCAQVGTHASFEAGLFMGVAMTLCARKANGVILLKKMLADIIAQQDETQPTAVEDELSSDDAHEEEVQEDATDPEYLAQRQEQPTQPASGAV